MTLGGSIFLLAHNYLCKGRVPLKLEIYFRNYIYDFYGTLPLHKWFFVRNNREPPKKLTVGSKRTRARTRVQTYKCLTVDI